ncbi:MAG: potassium transporter KtrB [Lachnospiraceae bacterium]|nr:potassium transporter KtrB [Lachnospiraceae bacterium]MDE6252881.1 potassium transporter KtrB [Lachnospiraceae bacterium]
MNQDKKRIKLSTTQIIAIGFLTAILTGAILLSLPIASADGTPTKFVDALFTSATSVCVTGLVVVDTYSHWSDFGQFIIMLLIQCGGMGVVTFTTAIMVVIGRKVTLKDRLLLQDAFNLNTLAGLVKFLKRILKGTFIVEGIGALCYMFAFVPEYGARGIWISIFSSVSAFCNAGIDIVGSTSFARYACNPWINIVTMLLIILGGIGFIVWWDVLRVISRIRHGEEELKNFFKKLSLHSHIVIVTTFVLIFAGAVLVLLMEYDNPATIGGMNFGQKVMASFFQSVTTRTAGLFTVSQKGLHDTTAFICIMLMFIGGSPVGTAGGIKTSTFALLVITAGSVVKGVNEVSAYRKRIPAKTIKKALAVVMISVMVLFIMICLLSVVNGGEFMDAAFEAASAISTTGLSRDYTGSLNVYGKLIVTLCMYLGRVGPISMVIAFNFKNSKKNMVVYPEEDITVG